MVGDNLAPVVGLHFCIPLVFGCGKTFVKVLKALLIVGGIRGVEIAQLPGDTFGDAAAVFRIEPIVGIAEGVNVSHGAGHGTGRYVKDFGKLRSVQITGRANLDAGIAALVDERGEPSDLQLQAYHDQQIRLA